MTLVERFSARLEGVTIPSDIALVVRSFDLSAPSRQQIAEDDKELHRPRPRVCMFLIDNGDADRRS